MSRGRKRAASSRRGSSRYSDANVDAGRRRGRGRGSSTKSGRKDHHLFIEGGWLSEWEPRRKQGSDQATSGNRKAAPSAPTVVADDDSEYERASYYGRFVKPKNRIHRKRNFPRAHGKNQYAVAESDSNSSDDDDDEASHSSDVGVSSSVDSDFAEDYAANVDCKIDDLEKAGLLEQIPIDSMSLKQHLSEEDDSGSENESDSDGLVRNLLNEYGTEDDEVEKEGECPKSGVLREEFRSLKLQLKDEEVESMIECIEDSYMLGQTRQHSKNKRHQPGQKKRQHKEMIAAKRRTRALSRGVDLDGINKMLESMVLNVVDMLAFQPMKSRDCTLVQKLASAYHLKSGCQGSGKKRFVTVTRTSNTQLPQGPEKEHLLKRLGQLLEEESGRKRGEEGRMEKKYRRAACQAMKSMKHERRERASRQRGEKGLKRNIVEGKKRVIYSPNEPLNFVTSSENVEVEVEEVEGSGLGFGVACSSSKKINNSKNSSSKKMGEFEAHTKGFGSKMMAKMGFVEGCGLGREGQGITQAIQPSVRPKSLGLGAS